MELDNLKFLIDNLSALCGIPSRIYLNNEMIYYSSFIPFRKDPIVLDEKELLAHKEHVGYYVNELFFNYGILNFKDGILSEKNSILFLINGIPIEENSILKLHLK